jgi:hypothetical protein
MNRMYGKYGSYVVLWLLLTGCQGLYTGTLTLTGVVDSASKEYARLYNDGLIPPDVAAKATVAHAAYQKAAGVAHDALVAYKLSGDPAQYKTALEFARAAAGSFIEVIVPLLAKQKAATLKAQLQKASAP